MLVQFLIENFLSFGDGFALDLRAETTDAAFSGASTDALMLLPDGMFAYPGALVLGEPGAGKTNLLRALAFARKRLLHGAKAFSGPLPICRWRSPLRDTTRFAWELLLDGALYRYTCSFSPEQIEQERLSLVRGQGPDAEHEVFSRSRKNPILALTDVRIGPGAASQKEAWERLALTASPQELLLTLALREGLPLVENIGIFWGQRLQLVYQDLSTNGLAARLARHPELGGILTALLCKAGLSAEWVSVRKTPIGPDFFSDEDEQRQVVNALLAYPDAFVATPDGELIAEREGSMVDLFLVSLDVGLGRQPGQAVGFAVSELPETALRLLHVAPLLFSDPHAPSPCFVVDDLLRALPTNAAKEIVRSVQNRCPSQRVLTSEPSRAEAADPSRPVGFSGQKLVYLKNEASVLKNAAS